MNKKINLFYYLCYKMKHIFYCRYNKCKKCKRKIHIKNNTYLCIKSGEYFTSVNN